jgi:uncharacterized protein (TIGR03083 family)
VEVIVEKREYLQAFDTNWERLLAAAALGVKSPVPSCPGWNVGSLVGHMGSVFTFWNKWVRDRPRGSDDASFKDLRAEREARLPGFSAWREKDFVWEAAPLGVRDFARESQAELAGRLAELEPSEPVWTFFAPDQTAGFVQRRIAHETAVHCWDAQEAQGVAEPIEAELAHDGIDEFMDAIIQVNRTELEEQNELPAYGGERVAFRRSDGQGEWQVEFTPEATQVTRDGGPADATLSGPVSDLLLFLYGRIPFDGFEISGDVDLVGRWEELSGTF